MGYVFLAIVFFALLGFVGGGISVFFALEVRRRSVEDLKRQLDEKERQIAHWTAEANARLQAAQSQFNEQSAKWTADQESRWKASFAELQAEIARVSAAKTEIESKVISYKELADENSILKRDVRNLDLNVRKLQLDHELHRQGQEAIELRINELGSRYLKENVKWIGASLNQNNFVACKQRLLDVVERCRGINFNVSANEETALLANLKSDYEMVVRQAFEREEQARIKAQIREEQMREREIERELKQLEREREAIKAALERALRDAQGQHNEEVERLKVRLAEAEEKSLRAISQAQLTKSGFVYVLSNIGSFGDGVFKVGMSRRLDPFERVRELGGASVPFPFDVHMMISTDDAPTLENVLHRQLHKCRVNKTNPRKEYFRTDIETIVRIVKENHGEVEFIADAEALQFRQSISMTEEDQEFIEDVYDELEEGSQALDEDA